MSLMIEFRARKLLKKYMDAELKGEDTLAEEIEGKLNNAGWKISVGAEGYTVIRENGGLFSTDNADNENTVLYPKEQYIPQYTGTGKSNTNNTPMIIGISVVGILLIVTAILVIKAIRKNKDVVSG